VALATVRVSAHDIPRDVTVHVFVKPEGQRLRLVVRVALKSIMDVEFPRRDREYVDLARVDMALRDAAQRYISGQIDIEENGAPLATPRLLSTRFSLESDGSFRAYEGALAHLTG